MSTMMWSMSCRREAWSPACGWACALPASMEAAAAVWIKRRRSKSAIAASAVLAGKARPCDGKANRRQSLWPARGVVKAMPIVLISPSLISQLRRLGHARAAMVVDVGVVDVGGWRGARRHRRFSRRSGFRERRPADPGRPQLLSLRRSVERSHPARAELRLSGLHRAGCRLVCRSGDRAGPRGRVPHAEDHGVGARAARLLLQAGPA